MIEKFYIYVDGTDLDEVASELRSRIETFVEPYRGLVRVVDQRAEEDEASADLPDWDLGVNFECEALTDAEKKELVLFFQTLSGEFGRVSFSEVYCHMVRPTILSVSPLANHSMAPSTFYSRMKNEANQ